MSDRGSELIEHTADVGLRVWAPTADDVFAEAAIALIGVMGVGEGPPVTQDVSIESPDLDSLFVDWLSEVLFLFDARAIVPKAVRVRIQRDPFRLDATIDGVRAERFEQEGPAVKAVTYHGLEVGDTEATVYLDV